MVGISAAAALWFGAMVEVVIGGRRVKMVERVGGKRTAHSIYLCNSNR